MFSSFKSRCKGAVIRKECPTFGKLILAIRNTIIREDDLVMSFVTDYLTQTSERLRYSYREVSSRSTFGKSLFPVCTFGKRTLPIWKSSVLSAIENKKLLHSSRQSYASSRGKLMSEGTSQKITEVRDLAI